MDPERISSLNEEDFLDYLSVPDLKKDYVIQLKKLKYDVGREFEAKKDFTRTSKKMGIESDRKHRDLINTCVYPFTNRGSLAKTGYKYIRAAPLSEIDQPNFDFLLFKQTDRFRVAVFGECKGSISNYNSIIRELKDRISSVEENYDYIKRQHLRISESKRVFFEYVIAVPTNDAVEMVNKIIEREGGQIVWQLSIAGDPEISIAFPTKKIDKKIRDTMIHKDQKLNAALHPSNHTGSNRNAFSVFPQVHPYTKLCSLILSAHSGDSGLVVDKEDLKRDIAQDLFYMEDSYIDRETDYILQKGEEIGFLEWIETDNTYKIKARGTKRNVLEGQLEEKWIKNQLDRDMTKAFEEKKLLLRQEFVERRRKVRTIFDF